MKSNNQKVEVVRTSFDELDLKKLNSVSDRGYLQATVSGTLAVIFYVIVVSNEVGHWLEILITVIGSIALIFGFYTVIKSRKVISSGEKIVTKGVIWDIVEEFESSVSVGKHSKASGIRKYIFKIGDMKHCFYQYAHSYKFAEQDSTYDPRQDAYNVGDMVSIHRTLTGELIRISVDKKSKVPVDNIFSVHYSTSIKHKVKSDRSMLTYFPREIDLELYYNEPCYYFHIDDKLYPVPESSFDKYPAQAPVKILKDENGKLTDHIFLQCQNNLWHNIPTA